MTRQALAFMAAALLGFMAVGSAQQAPPSELQIVPVRGNIYMLAGAGGNITLSVGRDGVMVVDAGLAQNADRVIAAIQQLQRQVDDRLAVLDSLRPKFGAETRSTV